jgi:hypothetical protein
VKILLIGVTLLGVGCAHPKKVGMNYIIPVQAVTKVELVDCDTVYRLDANGNPIPPTCKKISVDYKPGTEQLEVK